MTTNQLKHKYETEARAALASQFNYRSPMQIPRLQKIVLNMTAGNEVTNSKAIEEVLKELELIAGQKPVMTRAHNSLAAFKLREEMPMGAKVTLRGDRMWSFLEKLIDVVIPRMRDFRGLNPKSFDGRGTFAMGIKEQIIFPEIDYDKIRKVKGLDVIIVTSAPTDAEALQLLTSLGMPFRSAK